nr:unnamed protein product [Digitaria exilis]
MKKVTVLSLLRSAETAAVDWSETTADSSYTQLGNGGAIKQAASLQNLMRGRSFIELSGPDPTITMAKASPAERGTARLRQGRELGASLWPEGAVRLPFRPVGEGNGGWWRTGTAV